MKVGLITCVHLPEPDFDAEPLADALRARGHEPVTLAWDDPADDPGDYDCCVLRSTWNYYHVPRLFLDWVRRAAERTRFYNPPKIVEWNLHKRYLLELEERGVPIVPTWLNMRGTQYALETVIVDGLWAMQDTEWIVIKPAIGAGSYRTRTFRNHGQALDDAQQYLRTLAQSGDVILQPGMRGFKQPGERSLIWIDGQFTHAIRKHPRYADDDESVEAAAPPTEAEREVALKAIAPFRDKLLYARVDVVAGRFGEPLVSEVELMEPSLFFAHGPHALDVLISALERRVADHV